MYILYGGDFTRALITEMVLAEGDIAYELRPVDIVGNEHRSPEYLAINPAGWVPALITPEGETLYETPAINLYLAERHGLTHLAPAVGEVERGAFLCGLFFITDDLEPVMKRCFYPHRYVLREEDTPVMKTRSIEAALERLGVIEKRLATAGPYHLGERISLVDLTLAYWAFYFDAMALLDTFPAVKQCLNLVKERPKLRPKFDEIERMRAEYAAKQAQGGGVK